MLALAALLFVAYLANVVAGRIGFLAGSVVATGLDDVAELLLLAISCTAFTVATLLLERERRDAIDNGTARAVHRTHREEDPHDP